MRLNELDFTTSKQLARTNWTQQSGQIEDWLTQRGFHKLGSGVNGSVWTDDHRAVVKVFFNDPCYVEYLAFCRRNRGDQHLPRVSKLFPIADKGGIVFMEPLSPCPLGSIPGFSSYFKWRFHGGVNVDLSASPEQNTAQDAGPFGAISFADNTAHYRQFAQRNPSLAATLDKIAQAFNGSKCDADLHGGNVMLRGKVPVITDPFV
jgi:hypothetical protein